LYSTPDMLVEIRTITSDGPSILVAADRTIARPLDGVLQRHPLPDAVGAPRATALLRDDGGNLWIGTQDQGLIHVRQQRVSRFLRNDGLSGDFVTAMLEDREGNVWVGTLNGLDRFRSPRVATVGTRQGLSADTVLSVLGSADGSVWLGTVNGLSRWKDGEVTRYALPQRTGNRGVASLFEDRRRNVWVSSSSGLVRFEPDSAQPVPVLSQGYIHAMAEDAAANLWVSEQERGLIRIARGEPVETTPWDRLGGRNARALVVDPHAGGLWLGFFEGGLAYLQDGQVRASYSTAQGLSGSRRMAA
jgi:ligand-binding sensor domain-containing protein